MPILRPYAAARYSTNGTSLAWSLRGRMSTLMFTSGWPIRPTLDFWPSGGAKFAKIGDSLPRTLMNHRAKFGAAAEKSVTVQTHNVVPWSPKMQRCWWRMVPAKRPAAQRRQVRGRHSRHRISLRLAATFPVIDVAGWSGSLNRVPASARGKGGILTSAGWQVTLCDPTWHVSFP